MFCEQIKFTTPRSYTLISQGHRAVGDVCYMHFHREAEFLYINSGKMSYTSDRGTFILHSGDIVFFNSNVPHSTLVLEPTVNTLFQFRLPTVRENAPKYMQRFLEQNNAPEHIFRHNEDETSELLQYISAMFREHQNRENAYDYYLTANIYAITAFLHRKNLLIDSSKLINDGLFRQILPVTEYIEDNYAEHITLKQMSDLLNLNEQYFCRLFKKATGSTPMEYLNFVRIRVAENLIRSGKNISEACYKSGFSSLSYFNRTFKKYKQSTPSEYKKISARKDALILD